ncbi:MAG: hypothetical protein QXF06_03555 [Archaeoglobaceae archaeon]
MEQDPFLYIKRRHQEAVGLSKKHDFESAKAIFEELETRCYTLNREKDAKFYRASKIGEEAKMLASKRKYSEAAEKIMEAVGIWDELKNERSKLWCLANYSSWNGEYLIREKRYEEASRYFEEAAKFFSSIGDKKSEEYCKIKALECLAQLKEDPFEKAKSLFELCSKILSFVLSTRGELQKAIPEFLFHQMDAFGELGSHEQRIRNFRMAIKFFQLAREIAKFLDITNHENWFQGKIYECEYQMNKFELENSPPQYQFKFLDEIIKSLEKAQECYGKSDNLAKIVVGADLEKYRGIMFKINQKFDEAKNCFIKAETLYQEAAKVSISEKDRDRHIKSSYYARALCLEIDAYLNIKSKRKDLRQNLKEASRYLMEASCYYRKTGDFDSSGLCEKLSQAFESILNGDFQKARTLLQEVQPHRVAIKDEIELLESLTSLMEERLREIEEEDKGASFEARVRELIGKFDNRELKKTRGIYPECDKIYLHKYEEVRGFSDVPREEELGYFPEGQQIEVDVIAFRSERGRKYFLVAECKNRPNYEISSRDLELLLKKCKFIEIRYSKIADLMKENKPEIEEKWFITVGKISDEVKNFAKDRGIRIISKEALNTLFKEFGLRRIP